MLAVAIAKGMSNVGGIKRGEGIGGEQAELVSNATSTVKNALLIGALLVVVTLAVFLGPATPGALRAAAVARWLPGAGREAPETAAALREILACGAERVVLRASSLTSPWRRYLAEACGAPAPLAGPDGAGAEATAAAEVQDI